MMNTKYKIQNIKYKFLPKSRRLSGGFTLLELMISISIFSLIALFVVNFFISLSRVYLANLSVRNAQQNVRLAMETITRNIKQARKITDVKFNDPDGRLTVVTKEENGSFRTIKFDHCSSGPPACGNGTQAGVGVILMDDGAGYKSLTSTNLDVIEFNITASPGIPLVLNITIKAKIQEKGKSWERGAGGAGEIQMSTSAALKGQYY